MPCVPVPCRPPRSGQKYMVGDQDDYCKMLSCFGGKPGECQSTAGPWQGQQVMCGGRAAPPLLELSIIDGLAGTRHGSVVLERIGLDGAQEAAQTTPVCLDGRRARASLRYAARCCCSPHCRITMVTLHLLAFAASMAFRPLCFTLREKGSGGVLSKGCLDELILRRDMLIQQVALRAQVAGRAPGEAATAHATMGSDRAAAATL
eukprot:368164-Prymnesium_polylepis.1